MYIGKNYGDILVNVSGSDIYSNNVLVMNQLFTWDGSVSASAPLSTSYINTGIYRMFSSRQPPQLTDIAGVQSLFSNYFTKTQIITTTALVNYYTRDTIDGYLDAKIDTADVEKIIYTSDNKNYITAMNLSLIHI